MWALPRIIVQLDTIAGLRDFRHTRHPDTVEMAMAAQSAGSDGFMLTYLEADKQQRMRDFTLLRHLASGPIFMALPASAEALRAAYEIKPQMALLIGDGCTPLAPYQSYDLVRYKDQLRNTLQSLKDADITTAVLVEPELELIKALHRFDVPMVVLNCAKLVQATSETALQEEMTKFVDVVKACRRLGMEVACAGGLTPRELRFLAPLEEIQSVIVGHWLWSRAMLTGLNSAFAELKTILAEGPRR